MKENRISTVVYELYFYKYSYVYIITIFKAKRVRVRKLLLLCLNECQSAHLPIAFVDI